MRHAPVVSVSVVCTTAPSSSRSTRAPRTGSSLGSRTAFEFASMKSAPDSTTQRGAKPKSNVALAPNVSVDTTTTLAATGDAASLAD